LEQKKTKERKERRRGNSGTATDQRIISAVFY
jgi:hypothetical protein